MGSLLTLEPFIRHRAYTLWRLEPHRTDSTKPPIKVPVHYDGTTKHSDHNPAPPLSAAEAQQWIAHHHATGTGHATPGQVGYLGAGFRPEGTGLVCVDMDDCITAEGWTHGATAVMAQLPGALIEQSIGGSGAHIWCTSSDAPGRCPQRITPHGAIEVYSDGQFIACGTVLGGDASVDHTAAVQRMVRDYWPGRVAGAAPVVRDLPGDVTPGVLADLHSALDVLDPDCSNDEWVSVGQALASLGDTGLDMWTAWSARSTRFPGGDGLERWRSFTGDRTDYRAIFAKAQRGGWVNPSQRPALPADAGAVFAASALPAGAVAERPAATAPEYSEDALALAFVEQHREFRWTPGVGWMHDDAVVWSRDEAMRRYDTARSVCRAATDSPLLQPSERKRIASAKTINAVLVMAQSDARVVVPSLAWDADPMALNTPGGIVDLRTGQMRARGIEYVTQAAAVAPAIAAHPVWTRFLLDVFCEDLELIEFMQRSIGYWVSGARHEQVVHFLYGRGANGKGVLMDFLKWLFGSYGHKLPASALMTSKMDRHPTELAELRGKRLVLSSELDEGAYFNEALLKELTGDHTLTARFMRGDFFEFTMTHKHVIVGNFRPRLRGGDPAMARRMLLVPFNASFRGLQRDPNMLEKLKAEAPAIMAWVIDGARKWHAGGLAVPAAVRDASSEYMEEHDDTALWLAECCDIDPAATSRAGDLYASFRNWKQARGEHAPSQTAWGPRMAIVPGIERRRSNGFVYAGVRLRLPFSPSLERLE